MDSQCLKCVVISSSGQTCIFIFLKFTVNILDYIQRHICCRTISFATKPHFDVFYKINPHSWNLKKREFRYFSVRRNTTQSVFPEIWIITLLGLHIDKTFADDKSLSSDIKSFPLKSLDENCEEESFDIENEEAILNDNKYEDDEMCVISPLTKQHVDSLLCDKNGIEISFDGNFGTVNLGDKKCLTVSIGNTSSLPCVLLMCKPNENYQGATQFNVDKNPNYPILIPPNESFDVNVTCIASQLGRSEQLLFFQFEGFTIERILEVKVEDANQQLPLSNATLIPRHLFGNRSKNYREASGSLIPGERPCRVKSRFSRRLQTFAIPEELQSIALEGKHIVHSVPVLTEELSVTNYKEKFHTLLYLEEIQMNIDMKGFSMDQICFQPCEDYLTLEVQGLAENRPTLFVGDRITASDPVEKSNPVYEGFIHKIDKKKIFVKFNSIFHSKYNGESYDVEFHYNRMIMRRYHHAIEEALNLPENVLFPSKIVCKTPQVHLLETEASTPATSCTQKGELEKKEYKNINSIHRNGNITFCCPVVKMEVQLPNNRKSVTIKWHNKSLNDRQKIAVKRVLDGTCRPMPYVIFGPPGTGKTKTVVECIVQIFSRVKSSRILVCTPSNSAADVIVQRLVESKLFAEADLVRLNAFHNSKKVMPDDVKPFCKDVDKMSLISSHRIIVCTCVTAGKFYSLGLTVDHFTHLFLDEAGQATEPESMLAIELVATGNGQVVLAGDPQQLGPVVHSYNSKENGLKVSFLERIMALPLYQRNPEKYRQGNYNPLLITKLVENYRSHSCIISLSSQIFYDSELVCSAPKSLRDTFCKWEGLPNRSFPMIFCGVRGENLWDSDSPSWFNLYEVQQIIKYLKSLYALGISPNDIGIITPYRKQVGKIKHMINMNRIEMCQVGSVEEFQGQERLVIIISTVRSSKDQLNARRNLGFLTDPKRFNVAITRAQALLIVIGDPYLLCHDKHWRKLISYCLDQKSYCGSAISLAKIQDLSSEE
ncbi:RNA helicase Mov10l1-like isoform X2 [Centruroides sculpturatus]|uniref:RNA helicase Mov10l1-like isoform X1 n=2 Tax=Centruroides sculpturatus TaxID=218467 RepID=UPI000C6E27BB|nr:RNA helicase Mov10l1-like isoform X1 [Centruroides sculpturatus]XP_023243868.1 RNA helicase Mov10l1-like isoform X2 [Centruroides sculpturatus]